MRGIRRAASGILLLGFCIASIATDGTDAYGSPAGSSIEELKFVPAPGDDGVIHVPANGRLFLHPLNQGALQVNVAGNTNLGMSPRDVDGTETRAQDDTADVPLIAIDLESLAIDEVHVLVSCPELFEPDDTTLGRWGATCRRGGRAQPSKEL